MKTYPLLSHPSSKHLIMAFTTHKPSKWLLSKSEMVELRKKLIDRTSLDSTFSSDMETYSSVLTIDDPARADEDFAPLNFSRSQSSTVQYPQVSLLSQMLLLDSYSSESDSSSSDEAESTASDLATVKGLYLTHQSWNISSNGKSKGLHGKSTTTLAVNRTNHWVDVHSRMIW